MEPFAKIVNSLANGFTEKLDKIIHTSSETFWLVKKLRNLQLHPVMFLLKGKWVFFEVNGY